MAADTPIRLLAPLWLGLTLVAAITGALMVDVGTVALRKRAESIREERFRHSAQTLRLWVEGALSLGLPLEQLPRVQSMLEAERAAAPGTLSIELFDRHGRVLFGTDRSFVGDLVSENLLNSATAAGSAAWHVQEDDAPVAGAPVVNGFGVVVGQVAVHYAPVSDDDLIPVPATVPATTGAVFALALAVVLKWLYRPLGRNLGEALAVLAGAPPSTDAPALAIMATQARRRVETRMAALDEAEAEARRLDDNA